MTEQIIKLTGHDGENELDFGAIIFDGENITQVIGPDGNDLLLQNIVDSPVWVENGGEDLASIYSKNDPKTWFEGLPRHYKSYGLMASLPRELQDADLAGYKLLES